MRHLAVGLALTFALALGLASPADAGVRTDTRTVLAAATKGGIIGFRVGRYEERAHGGYVLASGHVYLQVRRDGSSHWRTVPRSYTLAYKGRAMLFYRYSPTVTPERIRAVSRDPGYLASYSKPVHLPLRG